MDLGFQIDHFLLSSDNFGQSFLCEKFDQKLFQARKEVKLLNLNSCETVVEQAICLLAFSTALKRIIN